MRPACAGLTASSADAASIRTASALNSFDPDFLIENNFIANNLASDGGGVKIAGYSSPVLINNIIVTIGSKENAFGSISSFLKCWNIVKGVWRDLLWL